MTTRKKPRKFQILSGGRVKRVTPKFLARQKKAMADLKKIAKEVTQIKRDFRAMMRR